MTEVGDVRIGPHAGPQERALASSADILVYGGSAGGGKSYGILLEASRHLGNSGFEAVLFRRTNPLLTQPGGLWDTSFKIYPELEGEPFMSPSHEWRFPSGATISLQHMQHEKDRLSWKGAQIPLICFDQIEEFTEAMFWYLVSRNRSTCGVRPYMRLTANPVPPDDEVGGWLHKLVGWWIDPKTGLAIEERSGVIRCFIRDGDDLVWFDERAEASRYCLEHGLAVNKDGEDDEELAELLPRTFTFIGARLEDNPTLMTADPEYLAKLLVLPRVDRERLYGGNWLIRESAGTVFDRAWFKIVNAIPANVPNRLRYWDKAGTDDQDGKNRGAMSAGVKWAGPVSGIWYIEDAVFGRWSALDRERVIKQTAEIDGYDVTQVVEQEPGSGGKESAESTIRMLAGWNARKDRVTGTKVARAGPLSAQAEAGNVRLLLAEWNEEVLGHFHRFPDGVIDLADAAVGGFNWISRQPGGVEMGGFTNEGLTRGGSRWKIGSQGSRRGL